VIARYQDEHARINAREYPGTRQLCKRCEQPTDRCEEDAIYLDDDGEEGPLYEDCYHSAADGKKENRNEGSKI
jgi:hypothetical protein